MRTICCKTWALLFTLALLFGLALPAAAAEYDLDAAVKSSAAYMLQAVPDPQVGSIGGEWAVIGLARSGYPVPQSYWDKYYETVAAYVKARDGVLHEKKYTEYSRVIVALSAIGADPSNVAGYNLLTALGDYDKTIWQGLNGPIWALLALDSGNYAMPNNPAAKTQATRQMYIDRILECQLPDGGWSLFGGTKAAAAAGSSDPDITGMALQALAKYQEQPAVAKATAEALECMSRMQDSSGGFFSWDSLNSESTDQMLLALCELGIPLDDPRFVKEGHTLLDAIFSLRQADGSFLHVKAGAGSNQMASEQGLIALAAAKRASGMQNGVYRMDDGNIHISAGASSAPKPQNDDTAKLPGTTFSDITAHANRPAIEALASRGIITGMADGLFHPDDTMTRAQFAAIVVRGLGLDAAAPQAGTGFDDVAANAWYAGYIAAASDAAIITGRGNGLFDPDGTITRQEAAVMVARAAAICGLDTELDAAAVRDVLAQFADYVQTAAWARESLAFCYQTGILDDAALTINGGAAITRGEIAQMLYNLLTKADRL